MNDSIVRDARDMQELELRRKADAEAQKQAIAEQAAMRERIALQLAMKNASEQQRMLYGQENDFVTSAQDKVARDRRLDPNYAANLQRAVKEGYLSHVPPSGYRNEYPAAASRMAYDNNPPQEGFGNNPPDSGLAASFANQLMPGEEVVIDEGFNQATRPPQRINRGQY